MSDKNVIEPIPRASFDVSGLTGSYQAIDASGFDNAVVIIKMYNGGTTGVDISWDGSTDHDYMPAGSTLILDIATNRNKSDQKFAAEAGQIIYVKGTAGTGNVYLSAWRIKE